MEVARTRERSRRCLADSRLLREGRDAADEASDTGGGTADHARGAATGVCLRAPDRVLTKYKTVLDGNVRQAALDTLHKHYGAFDCAFQFAKPRRRGRCLVPALDSEWANSLHLPGHREGDLDKRWPPRTRLFCTHRQDVHGDL